MSLPEHNATYPFGVRRRLEDAITRTNFWRLMPQSACDALVVLHVRVAMEETLWHRTQFERFLTHHLLLVLLCFFLQIISHCRSV